MDSEVPPILGRKACEKLNLINRVQAINSVNDDDFLKIYEDCFGEVGTSPNIHHITVDPNVNPVIHAACKIPIALQSKLKCELDKMIDLDVIEPVNGPSGLGQFISCC